MENPNDILQRPSSSPAAQFPPLGMKVDPATGGIVPKTNTELVADGDLVLQLNQKLVDDVILPKSMAEMIEDGSLTIPDNCVFDEVENAMRMKSNAELYEDGKLTYLDVVDELIQKMRIKEDEIRRKFRRTNIVPEDQQGYTMRIQQATHWQELGEAEKLNVLGDPVKVSKITYLLSTTNTTSATDLSEVVPLLDTEVARLLGDTIAYQESMATLTNLIGDKIGSLRTDDSNKSKTYNELMDEIDAMDWPE